MNQYAGSSKGEIGKKISEIEQMCNNVIMENKKLRAGDEELNQRLQIAETFRLVYRNELKDFLY